ncbi:hypothetical protein SISSUDRAFT_1062279 [Sistotremastrum suecicum HHB10207 ss-3]|uniref:F-box domain-containing protein n=1 Tax=Sistotremastrum suecicum HHB10207 ss-3 TaxID=1314776 RepID=A0A166D2M2_9AGAM|nr:hypothetical protein SISSUDRAFT_1062279 [Sistotremastrum suecicum HHB10207 ss-3]
MSWPSLESGGLVQNLHKPGDMDRQDCADEANDDRTQTASLPQDPRIISLRSIKQNSPLLRLPHELILQIILMTLEDPRDLLQSKFEANNSWELADQTQSFDRLRMTNRMTHISSTWRYVCLNATTLWNAIDLLWPSTAVAVFATRAQQSPLFLNLNILQDYQRVFQPLITDSLTFWSTQIAFWTQFLSQNMHRVKSLEIRVKTTEPRRIFPEFWRAVEHLRAPKLEKIVLRFPPRSGEVAIYNPFFRDAPRLRELLVEGFKFSDIQETSFHSLVRLTITLAEFETTAGFKRLTSILSATPNLEALQIAVPESYSNTARPLTPFLGRAVPLNRCAQLKATGLSATTTAFLFSSISFPSLSVLALNICMPWDASPDAITELYTCLPHSMRQLCHTNDTMTMTFSPCYLRTHVGSDSAPNLMVCHNIPDLSGAQFGHSCLAESCTAPFTVLNLSPISLKVAGLSTGFIGQAIPTKDLWRAILSHAPFLEVLELESQFSFAPLCEALEDPRLLGSALKELRKIGSDEDRDAFDMMLERRKSQGAKNEIVLITGPDS